MRIRIIQKPTESCIDGLRLDKFVPGHLYEVGNMLGTLFLSEGWAEPVDDPEPALVIPLREFETDATEPVPKNLIRESYPPYYDQSSAIALDRRHRPRRTR
jgi:hypothetical protein